MMENISLIEDQCCGWSVIISDDSAGHWQVSLLPV